MDRSAAGILGLEWMNAHVPDLPLDIVDDAGGVALTIAHAARAVLAQGADQVMVITGQLAMSGLRRRLLHDGTAEAIRRAVDRIPGAVGVVLPVPVEP